MQAFTAWQAHTSQKVEGQEKLKHAVARLQHYLLARAFATFASHAQHSADLRQRLSQAVAAFKNGTLRAAFNAWLDHSRQLLDSRQQVGCYLNLSRSHRQLFLNEIVGDCPELLSPTLFLRLFLRPKSCRQSFQVLKINKLIMAREPSFSCCLTLAPAAMQLQWQVEPNTAVIHVSELGS